NLIEEAIRKQKNRDKVLRLESKLSKAVGYYRRAKEFIGQKRVLSALKPLQDAGELVKLHRNDPLFYEARENILRKEKLDLDQIQLDRNLIRDGIFLDIVSGDGQRVEAGARLPLPLKVKAGCNLSGKEIPLVRVPVVFKLKGEKLAALSTDQNGFASLDVLNSSRSADLKIVATIDREPWRGEATFNITVAGRKTKGAVSINYSFIYEKDGRVGKLENGMSLRSENASYESSDKYKIWFSPEQECFVYIYQVDSSGAVYQLFPNREYSDYSNPVKKYHTYIIPRSKHLPDGFPLDQVRGEERLYLLAAASEGSVSDLLKLSRQLKSATDARKTAVTEQIKNYLDNSQGAANRGLGKTFSSSSGSRIKNNSSSFNAIYEKLSSSEDYFVEVRSFQHE
ncbi:MAG: DUF4384 domain-containing protein, partial [bacterium]